MNKIIILSGAGLSAQSGISTFRDADGLWENYDINRICMAGCLDWNYDETIHFYNLRRTDISDKTPNHAHEVIAQLKTQYPNQIEVITQNVDDLLEKAQCPDVLHLHGFLPELRCMQCDTIVNVEYDTQDDSHYCQNCGGKLRPNIVFFGEAAPKYQDMHNILNQCGLFITIGTSGNVINVSQLTQYADFSILNNLESSEAIVEEVFDKIYYENATTAIDKIKKDIEKYIESQEI
ncbi:MAG: Sir2 family NAD-dependent protein deacetylase [Campylobacterota bacterium]|nr:Sir2 family NAD-dependent protein deacetylase [Campylobacterota bacterium]